eukprot:scaffold1029_cov387-Prasinococcus_capsulatus_cf.AAC.1
MHPAASSSSLASARGVRPQRACLEVGLQVSARRAAVSCDAHRGEQPLRHLRTSPPPPQRAQRGACTCSCNERAQRAPCRRRRWPRRRA